MKNCSVFFRVFISVLTILLTASTESLRADQQAGHVFVQAVQGDVTFSTGGTWQPLTAATTLGPGSRIKTGADSTVDLILQYNGTVLRLTPKSEMSFDKLNKEGAGEEVITETSVNLLAGAVVGSQRKLASPSRFDIKLPGGVATIRGTEYLVRADGAVTTLSGTVSVNYNLPAGGGSVKVTVPSGFSFNPASGSVVPTTPPFLDNIIADINTVRQNAQVFKAGGATVVVKPEEVVSPTKGSGDSSNPDINSGPGGRTTDIGRRDHSPRHRLTSQPN